MVTEPNYLVFVVSGRIGFIVVYMFVSDPWDVWPLFCLAILSSRVNTLLSSTSS